MYMPSAKPLAAHASRRSSSFRSQHPGAAMARQPSYGVLYSALASLALYLMMYAMAAGAGLTGQPGALAIVTLVLIQLTVCIAGAYMVGRIGRQAEPRYTDDLRARDRASVLLVWGVTSLATLVMLSGGPRIVLGHALDLGSGAMPALANTLSGMTPAAGWITPDMLIWTGVALVLSLVAANFAATFAILQRNGLKLQRRGD
jgi:hypothetical protein